MHLIYELGPEIFTLFILPFIKEQPIGLAKIFSYLIGAILGNLHIRYLVICDLHQVTRSYTNVNN